jgi:hypothetical protein
MNESQPNLEVSSQEEEPKNESIAEQRKSAWGNAVETFKIHDGAELELEQLYFHEKLAKSGEEAAISALQDKIRSAQEQRDIYENKEQPFDVEPWACRVELLQAMETIFRLYCGAKDKSPELAGYIREIQPWVGEKLEEAEALFNNADVDTKVETGEADDYNVDGGVQKAA